MFKVEQFSKAQNILTVNRLLYLWAPPILDKNDAHRFSLLRISLDLEYDYDNCSYLNEEEVTGFLIKVENFSLKRCNSKGHLFCSLV